MEMVTLSVSGMSCSHCERAVINGLTDLEGVGNVSVDLAGNTVTVEFDSSKLSLQAIKDEIVDIGYEVN